MIEFESVTDVLQKQNTAPNPSALLLATVRLENEPDTGFEHNIAAPRYVYACLSKKLTLFNVTNFSLAKNNPTAPSAELLAMTVFRMDALPP
ncbi:unnamed protein product [Rotaria sordida]|uniref:Uncharacterized protein n=1 Tax=Rotaria sordida TaxID=392033 RepID=A0A814CPA1_9BILA|nr:unnamed protein product [Rotaria sordida]CAF3763053.1 unnamed protein product [Rotaria sordida]